MTTSNELRLECLSDIREYVEKRFEQFKNQLKTDKLIPSDQEIYNQFATIVNKNLEIQHEVLNYYTVQKSRADGNIVYYDLITETPVTHPIIVYVPAIDKYVAFSDIFTFDKFVNNLLVENNIRYNKKEADKIYQFDLFISAKKKQKLVLIYGKLPDSTLQQICRKLRDDFKIKESDLFITKSETGMLDCCTITINDSKYIGDDEKRRCFYNEIVAKLREHIKLVATFLLKPREELINGESYTVIGSSNTEYKLQDNKWITKPTTTYEGMSEEYKKIIMEFHLEDAVKLLNTPGVTPNIIINNYNNCNNMNNVNNVNINNNQVNKCKEYITNIYLEKYPPCNKQSRKDHYIQFIKNHENIKLEFDIPKLHTFYDILREVGYEEINGNKKIWKSPPKN